ncbi:MAG: hypothetical protein PVJ21_03920 [Anaerolineales bacterium]|jgi:hypothetical protein
MQPESMVHALEQIHDLLNPGGQLIDIHPNGELVEFYYALGDDEHFLGYMQETDDYIEYRQSDEALQTVINRKLFHLDVAGEFDFRTYTDSFREMQAFLEDNWSDAFITDEVVARAVVLENKHREFKTILREQVKIGLLKAL